MSISILIFSHSNPTASESQTAAIVHLCIKQTNNFLSPQIISNAFEQNADERDFLYFNFQSTESKIMCTFFLHCFIISAIGAQHPRSDQQERFGGERICAHKLTYIYIWW